MAQARCVVHGFVIRRNLGTEMAAVRRLTRVGGRDDDLLHHVPLHLVRHGVQRHEIVPGGARNLGAGDVEDAVENAATVAALLNKVKDERAKQIKSFQRDLRRRVAAKAAAERGACDDSKNVRSIAYAVATHSKGRNNAKTHTTTTAKQTPLEFLLASSAATARESHRGLLVSIVPTAFGGDIGRGHVSQGETKETEDIDDPTCVPPDVAESRRQRIRNEREAAAMASRRAASTKRATREGQAAHWRVRASGDTGVKNGDMSDDTTEDDMHATETQVTETKETKEPTTRDVALWLSERGLDFAAIPPVCACPHSFDSAPFDEYAAFRCARNCALYGEPDKRDEATRAALRALG